MAPSAAGVGLVYFSQLLFLVLHLSLDYKDFMNIQSKRSLPQESLLIEDYHHLFAQSTIVARLPRCFIVATSSTSKRTLRLRSHPPN